MTQVKINLNNPQDAQSAINAVLSVQIKLQKIVDALMHTTAEPDYKYLINYLVNGKGVSAIVSSSTLYEECNKLTERLIAAGVHQLVTQHSYAEIGQATLTYMVEERMKNNHLVIKGSDIRYKLYKNGKESEQWKYLSDSVQIIINKQDLSEDDLADFRQRQLQEALDAVANLGYTVDSEGMLVVI